MRVAEKVAAIYEYRASEVLGVAFEGAMAAFRWHSLFADLEVAARAAVKKFYSDQKPKPGHLSLDFWYMERELESEFLLRDHEWPDLDLASTPADC